MAYGNIGRECEVAFPALMEPSRDTIMRALSAKAGVSEGSISSVSIVKRSLDARGTQVLYRYRIAYTLKGEPEIEPYTLLPYQDLSKDGRSAQKEKSVIVVGAGPAGLFAALTLLQYGVKPILLERGKDVHARKYDIALLSRYGIVNCDSNYCFGEGGAGTFSDGKLYTRSTKRGDIRQVLYQFVKFGAPDSILIDSHPHIGSDRLPGIIENMRNCIISNGGEIHFNSRVCDMDYHGTWEVKCSGGESYSADNLILATGHSARDIYELFCTKNWEIQAKGFAIGVRVEHPQDLINSIRYKGKYDRNLPAAEYSVVTQVNGRGVFSFCMCPGGILVPASTGDGEVVLNGMSNSQRNSKWANAGIVVSVEPDDVPEFRQYGALQLLRFQEKVERDVYAAAGNTIKAPAQRMVDFVNGRMSTTLPQSSYHPGIVSARLDRILPEAVAKRLRIAFPIFNEKMRGYYSSEALLLAVESRTSSPVRIPRDAETLQHISLPGLYPCGEGAGYAGGIVSSAMDGINAAKAIAYTLKEKNAIR